MGSLSVRLGSIAGIDVRVHVTWLAVFGLVTWTLATGYYPLATGVGTGLAPWALGGLSALLLFGSVLLHELAHSLVARSEGLTVHSITLFLFGGVSDLAVEPSSARTELLVAIAGPAVSFAIALVTLGIAVAAPARSGLEALFGYLAIVDLLLAAFNLVPGFPLDGGRVLHAIAWRVTGDPDRAMRLAGGAGRLTAIGLFAFGAYLAVMGAVLDGVWLALIGWFLYGAASGALVRSATRRRLAELTVADAMAHEPTGARADEPVEAVLLRLADRQRRAVAVSDGDRMGVVTAQDLLTVPKARRPWTPVRAVLREPVPGVEVRPEEPLADALDALDVASTDAAPIVDGGRVVGLLLRDDIARVVERPESGQAARPAA